MTDDHIIEDFWSNNPTGGHVTAYQFVDKYKISLDRANNLMRRLNSEGHKQLVYVGGKPHAIVNPQNALHAAKVPCPTCPFVGGLSEYQRRTAMEMVDEGTKWCCHTTEIAGVTRRCAGSIAYLEGK